MQFAGAHIRIENRPGKLHHKFAVVDVGSSDPTVILGSYNWTGAGAYDNDENTLIVHDRDLAQAYYAEWLRLWSGEPVGPSIVVSDYVVTPTQVISISVNQHPPGVYELLWIDSFFEAAGMISATLEVDATGSAHDVFFTVPDALGAHYVETRLSGFLIARSAAVEVASPPPDLFVNDVSVIEGDDGTVNVSAVFSVTLSATSTRPISVQYATADGSATAPADYVAIPTATLVFAPGVTARPITVSIQGDTVDEPDEVFWVNLANAVNTRLGDARGQGTILDDDGQPSVRFSATDYVVEEAAGNATITVTLSNAYPLTVTVDFATTDGTALAGSDYVTASGTLTFTPDVVSRTFTVSILDDTLNEADETITLTLSNPTNGTLGLFQSATLTILDDDEQLYVYLPLVMHMSNWPSSATQGCLDSGGTVTTAMCCLSTGDFPNTCAVGACGCAPEYSHEVKICNCGPDKCFNGSECVPLAEQ
jgi:hypothetical protein